MINAGDYTKGKRSKVEDDGFSNKGEGFMFLSKRHATWKLHYLVEFTKGTKMLGICGESISFPYDVYFLNVTTRENVIPIATRK